MKKTLLFLFAMLMSSATAFAQESNQALTHTHASYTQASTGLSEKSFRVGVEAIGHGLPVNEEDSYSVGFWFNRTANFTNQLDEATTYGTILASLHCEAHMNHNGAYVLAVDNNGNLKYNGCWGFVGGGLNDYANQSLATIELNKWYFVLITVDNKGKKFRTYLGEQAAEGDNLTCVFDHDMTGAIGYSQNGSFEDTFDAVFSFCDYGFTGHLDNVMIFNRALDEDEALVAYYAPRKLTGEINALYTFDSADAVTTNAIEGKGDFNAQYCNYSFPVWGKDGFQTNDSQPKGSENSKWSATDVTPELVDSYEIPAIPTFSVTIPDLGTYEHATLILKKEDGTEINAGDTFEYELGDKIMTSATAETDYEIESIVRLGRTLNNDDYFYSAYDMREWRPITINTKATFVNVTVENPNNFEYTLTYADDNTTVDPTHVLPGRTINLTVTVPDTHAMTAVKLDGTTLTATDGVYSFARPDADFTITLEGHETSAYDVIVARTEGGTITVTDAEGNTIASGTRVAEGTILTITVTPDEDATASLKVNGAVYESPATYEVHEDVTITSVFEPIPGDYCTLSGTYGYNNGNAPIRDRSMSKLIVSDGASTVEVEGNQNTSNNSLYADRTATVLTTTAGATISIKPVGNSHWKNQYIYVDFDRNGTFEVDEDDVNVNGELVSHTGYTLDMKADGSDTADPSVTSDGTTLNTGNWNYTETSQPTPIPDFTLPADMMPGTYRVRYKLDWNNTNPCGRTASTLHGGQKGNYITDGGCIIDFTIVIPEPEVSKLTINITGNGSVEAWSAVDEYGNGTGIQYADGEGLFAGAPVYFFFYPEEKASVISATIENGDESVQGNGNGEATEVYVAGDVTATGVFSNNSTGIDGIDADNANAPVEYFNLQGVRVNAENLSTGFYIRRQGSKATKVFVTK